ncbi:MAG: MBL fold metallo-hydrolase [Elusimicrobia bacterium]|nr:MBL fold metallo-hydrolase [Elusimicrobiota bacterium]
MIRKIFLILFLLSLVNILHADLTIYFVDVGQGDAEFIVLPSSKAVLIDGGSSDTNISNFLSKTGYSTIDFLVLTHPHSDHYAGLNYVFDKMQVNGFYDTKIDNARASGDDSVRNKAKIEPGCTTYYPIEGSTLNWDPEVRAELFNTCISTTISNNGYQINDASIVLKLTYKGKSVLFTGDIGKGVEERLIKQYGDKLKADILKVAHHGSAYSTSTDFLNKVNPKYAIIEVGNNSYGHPTQKTLMELGKHKVQVYRTDTEGTLKCVITSTGEIMEPENLENTNERENSSQDERNIIKEEK